MVPVDTITQPSPAPDPSTSHWRSPAPRETGAPAGMPSDALLPGAELVPCAFYDLAPDFPPLEGGARSGIARDVYHPPR